MLNSLVLDERVAQPESASLPLTATFASPADDLPRLQDFVESLSLGSDMLAPRFFLAGVTPRDWRPLIVVVSQGPRIVGLLYCKERVIAGLGIRIAFGNDSLGTMIAAHPHERESVMRCGVSALLKRMLALRILVAPDQQRLMESFRTQAHVRFYPTKNHAHLPLPETFGEFLATLGPHTRRNFRNFRRKSESAGNQFSQSLQFSELASAATRLLPKVIRARSLQTYQKQLAMIQSMPSQLLAGLRAPTGEWIGLAGGWYESDRAFLVMQLNDGTRPRQSISVVLRSYLIESLINRGIRELVIWDGTSAPLRSYAIFPDRFMAHLDTPSFALRFARLAWIAARKLAPANFAPLMKWFLRDV